MTASLELHEMEPPEVFAYGQVRYVFTTVEAARPSEGARPWD